MHFLDIVSFQDDWEVKCSLLSRCWSNHSARQNIIHLFFDITHCSVQSIVRLTIRVWFRSFFSDVPCFSLSLDIRNYFRQWLEFAAHDNHTISLLYPIDFDTMAALVNHTLPKIESSGAVDAPFNLQWYPFSGVQCPPTYYVFLQGVFAPLIIIVSTILNSLIAVVLLQKHLRSPTNILLLAIALYDTLTGLFPFPAYIFVFTFRQCSDYMPYNYGWFHRINHDVLPFIFHTCSIWVIHSSTAAHVTVLCCSLCRSLLFSLFNATFTYAIQRKPNDGVPCPWPWKQSPASMF